MVGYGGQIGRYTDLETLDIDAGTYLQTFGPGKPTFYNPDGGIAMASNEAMYYEVQAEGIQIIGAMAMSSVGGPVGAAVGGAIWTYGCDRINGLSVKESAKDALIDGATNLAIAGVLHVAGQAMSGETAALRKGARAAEAAGADSTVLWEFEQSSDEFGRCYFARQSKPSVRGQNYPTRIRKSTRQRLETGATDANGDIRCQSPKCNKVLKPGEGTPEHIPPVVDDWNLYGYDSDPEYRNNSYNDNAKELWCIDCQKEEGGKMTQTYRTDTGPNYVRRGKRK